MKKGRRQLLTATLGSPILSISHAEHYGPSL